MEKLAAKYDGAVEVVKVDVDANPGLSRAFNILSIPTIAFFQPGKQPMGVVGFRPDGAARAAVRARPVHAEAGRADRRRACHHRADAAHPADAADRVRADPDAGRRLGSRPRRLPSAGLPTGALRFDGQPMAQLEPRLGPIDRVLVERLEVGTRPTPGPPGDCSRVRSARRRRRDLRPEPELGRSSRSAERRRAPDREGRRRRGSRVE